ncbi:hypothetical protein M747DRAFT_360785 [Aspergillus niger ATCC 13496]|uniref:Contig An07c0300, genomic contig n=3 Tax=Aspergillus niger TaxID=5061 RepID=A2QPB2_ASPNC|nr:uncharacterized protein An07g08840 [Aspergillus niger]RDH15313.1 hypothetical protein M747DRAFT_360785 [Aspergillus niger ATCC 13496]CAK39677.1 unnamed protein product [Aspergillus niger]
MELETGLDYRTPRLQNRWTREQRLFLCCLYKFFQRNTSAFRDIFNQVFGSEVTECGFTEGIPSSTLRTQWGEMVRHEYPEWREVQQHTSEGHWRWIPTLRRIRRTARSLGLHIVPNYVDDNEETSGVQEQVLVPEAIDITQIDISLCSGGDKVCFWCVQEQISDEAQEKINPPRSRPRWTDEVPPVIYRWSNIDSQGVNSKTLLLAGLFADGRQIFMPGNICQEKFTGYFLNHVHIEKTPSPSISTFRSMLAPIHRALWNKEGAIISIIDTKKLDTKVYPAIKLFREQNLRIRGYDVKISTIQQLADENVEIEQFLQLEKLITHQYNRKQLHDDLAKESGQLDRTSGFKIGKFLDSINLPFEFSRESFYEGVDTGYGRSTPSTNVSEVSTNAGEVGRPSNVYDISDDDSVTECGSVASNENTISDGDYENIGTSSPCMGRELAAHRRNPISTPGWFFIRNTDDEMTIEEVSGRESNLFSEQDPEQSAELITDWPEEDTQALSSLNISQVRAPTIKLFEPDTGRWVQEQAKMDEDDGQSYMQPPSTNDTQEMQGISEVEGESDIMHDIKTLSCELSEDNLPHDWFARDRERRRRWLFQ